MISARCRRPLPLLAGAVGWALASALTAGCSGPVPRRDPTGQAFPSVTGESLEKRQVTVPDDFADEPLLVIVGYVQETQFDLDRWLYGLLDAQLSLRFLELPAVEGLIPSMFLQDTIDDGMRAGIPPEDWQGVVTLYGAEAERVVEFTGNENPRNARVLLLDAAGTVVWFHDEGYSARELILLERAHQALLE